MTMGHRSYKQTDSSSTSGYFLVARGTTTVRLYSCVPRYRYTHIIHTGTKSSSASIHMNTVELTGTELLSASTAGASRIHVASFKI